MPPSVAARQRPVEPGPAKAAPTAQRLSRRADPAAAGAAQAIGNQARLRLAASPITAGPMQVQRSPLSDLVKDAWTADPTIETLLARLSQADVQTAQGDADIDAELTRLLAGRPDDLWLAQRVRAGKLGQSAGTKVAGKTVTRPVEVTFFRGSTDRRALVIAGVHGSEQQGIEVARRLINDLQSAGQPPGFTTIVVPTLFPDNAARKSREGATPTNRNFPPPSEDLADATAAGGGTAVDASKSGGKRSRTILPENLMLIELMERFHPERIISIHGTQAPGQAGVFYDRRSPSAEEERRARDLAQGQEGGQALPESVQERLARARLAAIAAGAEQTDRDLSLAAATKIDADTAAVSGRGGRGMEREKETAATTKAETPGRTAHPSVGGNVGASGALDNATWLGGVPGGISLGGYAPPRGMSVFTVEPPVDAASAAYPNASDIVSGAVDKLTKADRITELQAYADAVRTILLAAP